MFVLMKINKQIFFLIFLFHIGTCECSINYSTTFLGLSDHLTLSQLEEASRLFALEKKPPQSLSALQFRVEEDKNTLIQTLHANGYYDAKLHITLDKTTKTIQVQIHIDPGPRYILKDYQIKNAPCPISLPSLQIQLWKPVLTPNIIQARLALLSEMAKCSYPLSAIESEEITVNTFEKNVTVQITLSPSPQCRFGPITMKGLQEISPLFIERKIRWKEGSLYAPEKIEDTQKRLLKTDLFSSVLISHDEKVQDKDSLPMKIHVAESKHKSVSIGASYATVEGPGVVLGWTNRNVRGLGEQFSIDGELAKRYLTGIITYRKPDFWKLDQDYFLQLQSLREKITIFLAFSYSMTNRLDRKINEHTNLSLGIRNEYIDVKHSINDGRYALLELPIFIKYSTANHILNPTNGMNIFYYGTPALDFLHSHVVFLKQRLIQEFYIPSSASKKVVFAWKIQLGSILGPPISHIPMTKLFFGGSDDTLRGYRYRTVSPRNSNHDPKGGRSAIYFTFEPRFRVTENLGIVPFTDIGTVSTKSFPSPLQKWYKSVGIGLRYFTFFGPLRLDIGIPLNRRKLDPHFRVYASIGQSF
ncbi:MAG: autotransporter assembly complex family protein [Chlamydiota bacterium]